MSVPYSLHLLERSNFGIHFLGDLLNPTIVFADALVRRAVLTSAARARINVRWICAFALRCRTGPSEPGSILASRASVRAASSRSSFRLLSQLSAYPRRMHPGFQCDSTAQDTTEDLLDSLRCRRQAVLQNHFA
jgi:hypothetical protein